MAPEVTEVARAERINPHSLFCLAKNLYHEARGEGRNGMLLVASVTLERLEDWRWGNTICQVVYRREGARRHGGCSFEWACTGRARFVPKRSDASWQECLQLAQAVISKKIPVDRFHNALYYHSTKISRPKWTRDMRPVARVGRHIAYAERR